MTVKELHAALERAIAMGAESLEVSTEGCDCYGDVEDVLIREDGKHDGVDLLRTFQDKLPPGTRRA